MTTPCTAGTGADNDTTRRLAAALKAQGLDALVSFSPESFAYINGFDVPSQSLMRWRHAITVLTADARRELIVVDMEHSTTEARIAGQDAGLRAWAEFGDDPMQVLAGLLADMGLAGGRLALETDYLSAADFQRLREHIATATLAPAAPILARVMQIKTAAEIALLRRLSRIADEAIGTALAAASRGCTEMDIAASLTQTVYRLGAEQFKLMIVATGERSQLPNVGPSMRKLETADVCRVEIFPVIRGYHAGVCRTAVVERPPAEAERIWATLTECKHLVMEQIRPGASSREIYRRFVAVLEPLKLPPIKFIGHGIGVHLHQQPYLSEHVDLPLEAGMVLGIEPLVYRTGYGFGMQNKDMFLVTETGCELLSDVNETDQLLRIA